MSLARVRKLTVVTLGFTAAAGAGAVTCAYIFPEFRKEVERKIPQSKDFFAKVLPDSKYVVKMRGMIGLV